MPRNDAGAPAGESRDAAEPVAETTSSLDDPADIAAWIGERQAAREAQHAARHDWLQRANAEHRRARNYGLRARHAAKLNRRHKGTAP